jgi:hypothetical protein
MESTADFDLLIEGSGGQYRACMLESAYGAGEVLFQYPFSNLELENFYSRLSLKRKWLRRIDIPDEEPNLFGVWKSNINLV